MAGAPADAETETAGMAWTKAIDRMRLKADVDGTIGQGLGVAYGEDKPDMPVKGRVWYYHIKKGWTAAGDWKEVALYKDKGIIGPAPHPLRDSSKYKANRALATPKPSRRVEALDLFIKPPDEPTNEHAQHARSSSSRSRSFGSRRERTHPSAPESPYVRDALRRIATEQRELLAEVRKMKAVEGPNVVLAPRNLNDEDSFASKVADQVSKTMAPKIESEGDRTVSRVAGVVEADGDRTRAQSDGQFKKQMKATLAVLDGQEEEMRARAQQRKEMLQGFLDASDERAEQHEQTMDKFVEATKHRSSLHTETMEYIGSLSSNISAFLRDILATCEDVEFILPSIRKLGEVLEAGSVTPTALALADLDAGTNLVGGLSREPDSISSSALSSTTVNTTSIARSIPPSDTSTMPAPTRGGTSKGKARAEPAVRVEQSKAFDVVADPLTLSNYKLVVKKADTERANAMDVSDVIALLTLDPTTAQEQLGVRVACLLVLLPKLIQSTPVGKLAALVGKLDESLGNQLSDGRPIVIAAVLFAFHLMLERTFAVVYTSDASLQFEAPSLAKVVALSINNHLEKLTELPGRLTESYLKNNANLATSYKTLTVELLRQFVATLPDHVHKEKLIAVLNDAASNEGSRIAVLDTLNLLISNDTAKPGTIKAVCDAMSASLKVMLGQGSKVLTVVRRSKALKTTLASSIRTLNAKMVNKRNLKSLKVALEKTIPELAEQIRNV